MAEATDRPHGPESVPSDAEQRVSTQSHALTEPGRALGSLAPPVTETYRPLSLMALSGFGLAVVYALVVLVGAAVALFKHISWLMPIWTLLLPLAAVVLCWAARTRIRDSEGTLSGLAFTTWGLRLAILVGLTYTAYYEATFFAVRGQAVDCADRFLQHLKEGQEERAFLLFLGTPVKDMDSAELRNTLEARFNNPKGPQGGGELTRFRQAPFVRSIAMGGPETTIALKGVSAWEYSKDGYRVVLQYHITTALMAFDLNLETFGRDSKPGEPKGRQWQIVLAGGETGISPESRKPTPHGEEVMKKLRTAEQFATAWTTKINLQKYGEAYLDTLAPAERPRLFKGDGRKKLESGKLIRIDDKRFWAGPKQRADIIQRIRNTFQPERPTFMVSLVQVMPMVRESEDRITALFDVNLRYIDENTGKPQYVVQGQLVVAARQQDAANSLSAWRVEAIDIESGRTPPVEPARPPLTR